MSQLFPFLLLLCLLLVALFAASEAALAATNRVRLRHLLRSQHAEDAAGESPNDLSRDSQDFIATVTIAANVPLVAAASLTLWMCWDKYGSRGAFWISLGVALLTVALFQIAPRLVVSAPGALENLWWLKPARALVAILRPGVGTLLWIGRTLLAPLGVLEGARKRSQSTNDDEIRDLVEAAGAGGALDESRELIESIFTFGDTRVHEVMIPRPDITALPDTCSTNEIIAVFQNSGLSRLPIYHNSVDEIVGILHVKDVLGALQEGTWKSPLPLLRAPLYLPESKKIDAALGAMRAQKTHLAIVIDEFGGTAGLLTVEDILEELVGEIADEHDRRDESLIILDANTALADARLHTEDLEKQWGLSLPVGEFDTVGGFMIERLGREPRVGDRLELPEATLIVHSTRGRRPHRIHISRGASSTKAADEETAV